MSSEFRAARVRAVSAVSLGGHASAAPLVRARCGAPAGLVSLRELRLERCEALTSAAPLAELTRLEALSLALCCRLTSVSRLSRAPPPPHGAAAAQLAQLCAAGATEKPVGS